MANIHSENRSGEESLHVGNHLRRRTDVSDPIDALREVADPVSFIRQGSAATAGRDLGDVSTLADGL